MKQEMKIQLRSHTSTSGRKMAGARSLWRANGMKSEQMGKPLIVPPNSTRLLSMMESLWDTMVCCILFRPEILSLIA